MFCRRIAESAMLSWSAPALIPRSTPRYVFSEGLSTHHNLFCHPSVKTTKSRVKDSAYISAPSRSIQAAKPCALAEEGTPSCPSECLDFANSLADIAAEIVSTYFRVPIEIQSKMDKSPVTVADETVEAALRAQIKERFPGHSILGEERGFHAGESDEYVWVIDPIDGTASFITGKPLFGVLISLVHNGVPVLGILDQPILKERWVGVRHGAHVQTTFNGSPVTARKCRELGEAYLYTTSPHLFPGQSEASFTRLRGAVKRTNYGCDCYAFGLLALGFVDVVVEYGMKPWDYLALVPIVQGAGGVFTDWNGNELRLDALDRDKWIGECLAAGDPLVHAQALEALSWKKNQS